MSDVLKEAFHSLAERQIAEAIEAGEFEDLPGQGSPLPGAGQPDDDLWWVREWLKREIDPYRAQSGPGIASR